METDNILSLIGKTPGGIMEEVARRVKQRRLEMGWTQKMLASKAGVSLASYRRFELTGEISFRSLVMLAFALEMTEEFETLFSRRVYRNIDAMIEASQPYQRKRGKRNG